MSRPRLEPKSGPVGTFDPKLFRQAIQALGLTFRWSRAVACPCQLSATDQYDPTCPRCNGDGWWYINPDERTDRHSTLDYLTMRCTFSQANVRTSLVEPFGEFDFGTAEITVQPECRVGYRDRFIGVEMEMPWTEVLQKSASNVVTVGKSERTTLAQRQSFRYEPTRIHLIADEDGVKYWQDSHWRLREETSTEPTRLEWISGPATGKRYTVHYAARPVWIVDEATYAVQGLQGPAATLKGVRKPQVLPTTFRVKLDFLTPRRGA